MNKKTKMNKKIKAKWIAALRSGKYIQGRRRLRISGYMGADKFCCLGVLCNLHAEAHPRIAQAQTSPREYLGHSAMLPPKVMQWAGLRPGFGEDIVFGSFLAGMNDSGMDFNQIADVIDTQL